MMSGIYRIRNLINGKSYVGLSRHIPHRFAQHRVIRKVRSSIAKAIRKYGAANFAFEIVELCPQDRLFERERYWISVLRPEYNRGPGGDGNPHPHSEQTKRKLSLAGKRQWNRKTDQEKIEFAARNLTGPKVGHGISAESRVRMSLAHFGRRTPERVRAKMSASQCIRWRDASREHFEKRRKPVFQVDRASSVRIHRFSSIKEASQSVGIDAGSITKVLRAERKTAGGFAWQLAKIL